MLPASASNSNVNNLNMNLNLNLNLNLNSDEKKEKEPQTQTHLHSHTMSVDASPSKVETLECGICLDVIKEQGVLNSCKHLFCFSCIEKWSKTSNTCPMCKVRFKHLTKIDLAKKK